MPKCWRAAGIKLVKADIGNLQGAMIGQGATFDIILANYVLYHLPDVSSVLENAVRYLDDNGIFIATTNSNQNLPFISEVFRTALAENDVANFSDIRYSSFSSENASALVREYFQFVKNSLYEVEIVVQDKADILDYLESSFDNYDIDNDLSIRRKILSAIESRLATSETVMFPDRKITSIIIGKSPVRLSNT